MAEREYIDRNVLVETLNRLAPEHYDCVINGVIMAQDVADAAPVKHGHWIDKTVWWGVIGKCRYQCSVCGKYKGYKLNSAGSDDMARDNYCANCGAKMDEQEGDNRCVS